MIGLSRATPLELEEAALIDGSDALAGVPPCGAADSPPGLAVAFISR